MNGEGLEPMSLLIIYPCNQHQAARNARMKEANNILHTPSPMPDA